MSELGAFASLSLRSIKISNDFVQNKNYIRLLCLLIISCFQAENKIDKAFRERFVYKTYS